MRHQKAGLKLNRTSAHRKAMFRNMVTSLFVHGRVRTTDAKAKELRRWADQMVTLAKKGDLHARRQALAVMRDETAVKKLFDEVQDRFGQREGGYTRVVKIGIRRGDSAPISLVEFVEAETPASRKSKKKKGDKAKGPEKAAASDKKAAKAAPESRAVPEPQAAAEPEAASQPQAVEAEASAAEPDDTTEQAAAPELAPEAASDEAPDAEAPEASDASGTEAPAEDADTEPEK